MGENKEEEATAQLYAAGSQSTVPGAPPPETGAGFPVENWSRYEFIQFLGQGGMGTVFKAFDPRLKRNVALKFIRGETQQQALRFLQEAQAQARVEHDNVCKIYEVGEVEEKPYIAMQFVDGASLDHAHGRMTLAEKVQVMQKVSEGIHAAHRLGLIHRDIKPGNIMVEKRESGWHPFIMDFGLARLAESPQMTQAGFVLGTPAFMSPEQASGGAQPLDRRSDVFSLGATLYALLCGRPPFEGSTALEVLSSIANHEPLPLRRQNREIPRDLETIVMKCLEKDTSHRYDSARSLSDDLLRFLDGEPIQGRPASVTYRLKKKVRKHRAVAGVVAVALAVTVALSAVSIHARYQAGQRALVGQQFGQQIERVEAIMRYAYMSRLHEIHGEKTIVRQRMGAVRGMMKEIGPSAEGPGQYALGRGFLALHEYEKARQALQSAWDSGYRNPEVSFALGEVLGIQYQDQLADAESIPDRKAREGRKRQLEKDYKQPAIKYLKESRKAGSLLTDFGEASMAYYEKRYDEALASAALALKKVPWLYEARKLQGDVLFHLAVEDRDAAHFDAAVRKYQQANQYYEQAIREAESDPDLYLAVARMRMSELFMNLYSFGDARISFARIIDACDKARMADSANAEAWARKSLALTTFSEFQLNRGEEYQSTILAALDAAKQAIRLDDRSFWPLASGGLAYSTKGQIEYARGEDPRDSLDHAIEYFQKAIDVRRDETVYNDMGNVHRQRAEYEMEHSIDPMPAFNRAQSCFEKAAQINPANPNLYNNLGVISDELGYYRYIHGGDPTDFWKRSIANYEKSAALNPGFAYAYGNLAQPHLFLAQYRIAWRQDPEAELQAAGQALQKAIQIMPDHANFYATLSAVFCARAQHLVANRKDPSAALEEGRKALDTAIRNNPEDYYYKLQLVELDLQAAEYALTEKKPSGSILAQTDKHVKQLLKQNSEDADCHLAAARFDLLRARFGDPGAIGAGIDRADRALSIRPDSADALAVRACLLLLKSSSPSEKAEARKLLDQAITSNRNLRTEYEKYLQ